jgi:membrane protease YdiL (CAAX protease family)
MTAWAWAASLVASNLATIVWREGLRSEPPLWTMAARILLLGAFWVGGSQHPALQPLRPLVLALTAAMVAQLIEDVLYRTPGVTAWIAAAPWRDVVIWSSAIKLLVAGAMALTVLDLSRRDLFLVRGDLAAPGRIPLTDMSLPWTWMGPLLLLIFGAATAGLMVAARQPAMEGLPRLIRLLPVVLVFSAINAFGEEFIFRSVLLARLEPHVGSEQALWMTSLRFGLGHWYGNPSGPVGVVGAMFLGLMLGKSMLETRGFVWAWLVHFVLDVAIFSAVILGSPRS